MDAQRQVMVTEAARLAVELPLAAVTTLAQTLERLGDASSHEARRAQVFQAVPQPSQRAHVRTLLDEWLQRAPDISALEVALALRVAVAATRCAREQQHIELV